MYKHYPKKIKHYPSFKTLRKSLVHPRSLCTLRACKAGVFITWDYCKKNHCRTLIGHNAVAADHTNEELSTDMCVNDVPSAKQPVDV